MKLISIYSGFRCNPPSWKFGTLNPFYVSARKPNLYYVLVRLRLLFYFTSPSLFSDPTDKPSKYLLSCNGEIMLLQRLDIIPESNVQVEKSK